MYAVIDIHILVYILLRVSTSTRSTSIVNSKLTTFGVNIHVKVDVLSRFRAVKCCDMYAKIIKG